MSQVSSSIDTSSSSSSSGELDTTDSESNNKLSLSNSYKKCKRSRSVTPIIRDDNRKEESESIIKSRSYKRETINYNNYEQKNIKPSRCIGVFGMLRETTTRVVEDYFKKYGDIESIRIIRDYYSRESKGFCFIKFEKLSCAMDALEGMNGKNIEGKCVRVDYAIPRNESPYKSNRRYYEDDDRKYRDRRVSNYYYYKDRYRYDYEKRDSGRRHKYGIENSPNVRRRRKRHYSVSTNNSHSS